MDKFSCSFQCPLKRNNKRNVYILQLRKKKILENEFESFAIRILIFALKDKIKRNDTARLDVSSKKRSYYIVEVRLGKSVRRSSVAGVSSNFSSFATSLGAEETF